MSKFFKNYLVLILVLVICFGALLGVMSDGFRNWDKFQDVVQGSNSSSPVTSEKENNSLTVCSEVVYSSVFN